MDREENLAAMFKALAQASFSAARTEFAEDWAELESRVGAALNAEDVVAED